MFRVVKAVTAALCVAHTVVTALVASEEQALRDFYQRMGGPQWTFSPVVKPWNLTENPCTWYGVVCDAAEEHVNHFYIDGIGVKGDFPGDLILKFTELTGLELSSNLLTGELPANIGQLTKLEGLYLEYNSIGGDLPASLFTIPALTSLQLDNNAFTGTLPPPPYGSAGLLYVTLQQNSMTGALPADLSSFAEMTSMDLTGNQFTHGLPAKLPPKLTRLLVGTNQLVGPAAVAQTVPLTEFVATGNCLTLSDATNAWCNQLTKCEVTQQTDTCPYMPNPPQGGKPPVGPVVAVVITLAVLAVAGVAFFKWNKRRRALRHEAEHMFSAYSRVDDGGGDHGAAVAQHPGPSYSGSANL